MTWVILKSRIFLRKLIQILPLFLEILTVVHDVGNTLVKVRASSSGKKLIYQVKVLKIRFFKVITHITFIEKKFSGKKLKRIENFLTSASPSPSFFICFEFSKFCHKSDQQMNFEEPKVTRWKSSLKLSQQPKTFTFQPVFLTFSQLQESFQPLPSNLDTDIWQKNIKKSANRTLQQTGFAL